MLGTIAPKNRQVEAHPLAARRPKSLLTAKPARGSIWVDRLLTMGLLVASLPVMAIVWCLVRATSRGPAIYTQRRSGLRGREFSIYKFRSMRHNCEKATGAVWAQTNDPRVTPIGHILRRSHLDELPQLFNVLAGDMLLVGPRPERPEIIERVIQEVPGYLERLEVPPGVTGLAQIFHGADLTLDDVRAKLRYDREYIAHRSVWLDLRIILCTALKVVGLNGPFVRDILFPGLEQRMGT